MALREIIILPDKQLRLVSRSVEKVTTEIRKLADDMLETMYDAPGIGLAAIQVAVAAAAGQIDLAKKNEDGKAAAAGLHQSGDRLGVGRAVGLRGRLPVDPRILRGGRAAGEGARALHRSRRQGARGSTPTACSPPASSTRSTISTACCSSTICRKLKRDRVLKKFAKAAKRAASSRASARDRSAKRDHAAASRLHGHAGFCGADAARARGARP